MACKALPPQSLLQQLFHYEPETGKLFWKERPVSMFDDGAQSAAHNAAIWNGKNATNEACSKTANGYLEVGIFGEHALAHRVIWKLVHGIEADNVDHIDGDTINNRLANLRDVAPVINGRNTKMHKNNTSGQMGVRWEERLKKWHARINVDYRTVHIGVFDSFDDAVRARLAAEVKYGFHENHGRA